MLFIPSFRVGASRAALDGAGVSGAWVTTFSQALTGNNLGWNGFNLRNVINAAQMAESGSKVRLTLEGAAVGAGAEDTQIASMWIQHAAGAGDAYDMEAAPTQVTVSASGSFVISIGTTVVTDEITFALDESKALVIAMYFNNSAKDVVRQATAVTGASSYFRSAADEGSTANVTGYTANAGILRVINKIEVFQAA